MSAVRKALLAFAVIQLALLARGQVSSGPDGDFGLVFRDLLAYTPSSLVSQLWALLANGRQLSSTCKLSSISSIADSRMPSLRCEIRLDGRSSLSVCVRICV